MTAPINSSVQSTKAYTLLPKETHWEITLNDNDTNDLSFNISTAFKFGDNVTAAIAVDIIYYYGTNDFYVTLMGLDFGSIAIGTVKTLKQAIAAAEHRILQESLIESAHNKGELRRGEVTFISRERFLELFYEARDRDRGRR